MAARHPTGGRGSNQYKSRGSSTPHIEAVRTPEGILALHVAVRTPPGTGSDTPEPASPSSRTLYTQGRPTHPDAGHRFNRRRDDPKPESAPWLRSTLPEGYRVPVDDNERWERLGIPEPQRAELESVGVDARYADACSALKITDADTWRRLAAAGVSTGLGDPFSVMGFLSWDVTDPDDMARYTEQGIDPVTAWSYRNHGISDADHIHQFRVAAVDGLDAAWSLNAGWTPTETVYLSNAGLSGLDTAAARAAGCRTVTEAVRVSRPRFRDRLRGFRARLSRQRTVSTLSPA